MKKFNYDDWYYKLDNNLLKMHPDGYIDPSGYPKNNHIKPGGETYVATTFIDEFMYKGDLHKIVNDYIIVLGVDNEWEVDTIYKIMDFKTVEEVKDFMYNELEEYLN